MEVTVKDIKSYIYVMTCICGEINKKHLLDNIASARYARKAIKELKDDGIIQEKKVDDQIVLRIKKTGAWPILEKLPPLLNHYNNLTHGNKFKTAPAQANRELRMSELIFHCLLQGIAVNAIKLTYEKNKGRKKAPPGLTPIDEHEADLNNLANEEKYNFVRNISCPAIDENMTPENYQDVIDSMMPNDIYMFLSQEVKRFGVNDSKAPTLVINPSRAFGHIIGRRMSYAIYLINPNEKLSIEIESRFRDYIEDIYQRAYGLPIYNERKEHSPNGECIILSKDINEIFDKGTRLTDIYSQVYMVDEDHTEQLALLTRNYWKQELLAQLFTLDELNIDNKLKTICDAVVDGEPAAEIVSLNLSKILQIKELLNDDDMKLTYHVYCLNWQTDIIRSVFDDMLDRIKIHVIDIII